MSKNSQDEPDEYEIIFDGAKSDSAKETTIEVSDADSLDTPEYIDAELNASDDFMKDRHNEGDDQDIDDGIFAPARREKPEGKKNSSLMLAVSLLAFVGVGAFVYVANPDIISKVTNNLSSNVEGGENITLPNDMPPADTAEIIPDDGAVQAVDPSLQVVGDSTEIRPDAVVTDPAQEAHVDLHAANTDAVDPSVVTPTPAEIPAETPVVVAPTVDAVQSDVAVVTQPEPQQFDAPATSPAVAEPAPVVIPDVPVADLTVATADVGAVPATTDVITPTEAKEEDGAEPVETDLSETAATPSTTVAPTAETVAAPPETAALQPAKENTIVAEGKAPVIVASKEEQKALDDANLDKYFDSPDGKILRDIPAPSMNPSKGGNESIIVVNKKGQKNNTQVSKPAGKVTIETTSLNAQVVSANRAVKLGRYGAAKEMYDELYKLNPRDGQILSGRAVLLQKMGFADQAIAAYEELLQIYPDNADAIVNLSGLIRKQYPAVALNKLLDLHMKHPNNVAVTAQLGVAYADSGNYADALRYLGDASSMEPKNALHFYNMAVISEKASNAPQAVSYYEKALEVDSIYGEGRQTISREKIYDRLAQIRGN